MEHMYVKRKKKKSSVSVPIRPFAFSYRSVETIYVIESVPELLVPAYFTNPCSLSLHVSLFSPPSARPSADCMIGWLTAAFYKGLQRHWRREGLNTCMT